MPSTLPRGVRRLFRLPRSQARMLRDTDDELRFHLEMRVAELQALGLSPTEARSEALRRFGDTEEFRAYSARRAARQARWRAVVEFLDEWAQDFRFAMRQFRKSPAFTALAVLTLALGIGANTGIFTVVHRLLLAPLPYPDGNRIVMLAMEGDDHSRFDVDGPTVHAWRTRAHSVETIAAVSVEAMMVQTVGEQDTIHAFITSNYLRMLGVHPVVGRGFTLDDERPGGPAVAMITYGLWQRRYGGRNEAVGSRLQVDGRPYAIVGVTPREMGIPMSFAGGRANMHLATPSIWLPVSLDSIAEATLFARLRPGVSAREASRELQAILDSDRPALPATPNGVRSPSAHAACCARAMRAQDFLDPLEARAVEVLFVAVGVLLLIACANVANLLMSRAWARRREFAVRIALGAGRGRLARLVLTESVTLALAGGLLGVGVAWETLRIIIALRPPALANLADVHIEPAVLLWSVGISVATGILFGSAPASFAGARSVGDVLRSEMRTGSGDVASRRMRSALIVAEIAMSLVLLVGAGLLVRSFVALQRMPLGFEPHGLVAVDVMLQRQPPEARFALEKSILERVRAVPGVTEAAFGTMPGEPYVVSNPLETEPDATGQSRRLPAFAITFMSPNYFRVARMSLVEGRLPDSTAFAGARPPAPVTDARATPEDVVVNRDLARRLWPDGHVIGARLRQTRRVTREFYRVVGVVDDVHVPGGRGMIPSAGVYRAPIVFGYIQIVARGSGSTREVTAALRRAVADYGPKAIAYYVTIGDDYLREALAPTRFAMALLVAFSVVALMLSAIGLYGVIAYAVSQRTREIGIRVALGAEPNAVARLVVGGGLRLTLAGALLGMAVAAASTRVLATLLYAVTPADPLTFAVTALFVVAIAILASYVPARRALRIDPMDALRAE